MSAAELPVAARAALRQLPAANPWSALAAIDAVVKARRKSEAWHKRMQAAGPEGDAARWDWNAMEHAREIVHAVAKAHDEARDATA